MQYLDFEKSIVELESKIQGLQNLSDDEKINITDEVIRLNKKLEKKLKETYDSLTPWQKAQVSRHTERPHAKDYIEAMVTEFTPLAGDRLFAEDCAIMGGFGRFEGRPVMVLGQEKGNDTASRIKYNFGMAKPEGYRKAKRLMELADQFKLPLITFVDTAGAYPGIEAEERGQAEAIAQSINAGLNLQVPFITTVIGEGGSGGAIAVATANIILMLEHSIYSVISPEGCASILWRSAEENKTAAEALKLTAQDLKKLDVIDEIIPEPLGGAHRQPREAIQSVQKVIKKHLESLLKMDGETLRIKRREKFMKMGRDES